MSESRAPKMTREGRRKILERDDVRLRRGIVRGDEGSEESEQHDDSEHKGSHAR
jgi:hypothetical protein